MPFKTRRPTQMLSASLEGMFASILCTRMRVFGVLSLQLLPAVAPETLIGRRWEHLDALGCPCAIVSPLQRCWPAFAPNNDHNLTTSHQLYSCLGM